MSKAVETNFENSVRGQYLCAEVCPARSHGLQLLSAFPVSAITQLTPACKQDAFRNLPLESNSLLEMQKHMDN